MNVREKKTGTNPGFSDYSRSFKKLGELRPWSEYITVVRSVSTRAWPSMPRAARRSSPHTHFPPISCGARVAHARPRRRRVAASRADQSVPTDPLRSRGTQAPRGWRAVRARRAGSEPRTSATRPAADSVRWADSTDRSRRMRQPTCSHVHIESIGRATYDGLCIGNVREQEASHVVASGGGKVGQAQGGS